MAIKFFNIKTGEEREVSTEPMIAAFWSSSDLGPNVSQGQDMGWRLAPETVVEVKSIRSNPSTLRDIAQRYQVMAEDLTDAIILKFIADKAAREVAAEAVDNQDYTEEYQEKIQQLQTKNNPKADTIESEDKPVIKGK